MYYNQCECPWERAKAAERKSVVFALLKNHCFAS